MTICLVDGDIICYRCAASVEPSKERLERGTLEVAIQRCEDLMQRIMHETSADSHKAFISGEENFRYAIDPNYKANRRDVPRPTFLQDVREYLVVQWGAVVSDGIEADDNLGIHQTSESVIASIDKDLLQIPGHHFNFVKNEWQTISEHQGWVNFYTQLVLGDRSDNIKGFDGKMRQTVPQFLLPLLERIRSGTSRRDMFEVVRDHYELGDDALYRNAQLLYIQRCEGDKWVVPDA